MKVDNRIRMTLRLTRELNAAVNRERKRLGITKTALITEVLENGLTVEASSGRDRKRTTHAKAAQKAFCSACT